MANQRPVLSMATRMTRYSATRLAISGSRMRMTLVASEKAPRMLPTTEALSPRS